jgi:multidrug efflux pump subunit AcrB
VPALSGFITPKKPKEAEGNPGKEHWYQRAYTPVLKWSLRHRAATLGIAAVLFFGSFALLPIIGTSFLPEMTEKMLTVEIELPLGAPLDATDAVARSVEAQIAELDDVKRYYTTVGASPASPFGAVAIAEGRGANAGDIMVLLDPDADMEAAAAALRSACSGIAPPGGDITIHTGQEMMEMGTKMLMVSITGTDYSDIKATADELVTELEGMGGLEDIESDAAKEYPPGNPLYIRHYDGQRSVRVMATITASDVGAINREVQDRVDNLNLPPGVDEVKMGGVAETMEESFSSMYVVIGVAIVIAYAVMVFFMRSFLNPLIIMVSLPLAFIGVFLSLLITGRPLGISSLMGILMLVGIVLTNAIVLIALVEQSRKQGMSTYDALIEGGRTRLRPILMTALTTMLALFPLALGLEESTLLAAELGTVVIGGLFTSTLLTLLVIPVIYSLVDGLRHRKEI